MDEREGARSGTRERRDRAKGMYKGVKAGRGRSEIDTAGEVSLAIPAISSRVARLQFATEIIADSLLFVLMLLKERILYRNLISFLINHHD